MREPPPPPHKKLLAYARSGRALAATFVVCVAGLILGFGMCVAANPFRMKTALERFAADVGTVIFLASALGIFAVSVTAIIALLKTKFRKSTNGH